jgi:putative nucleotidyltransferase with HDIG domain
MIWSISKSKEWNMLREEFSWISDMETVIQDPIHHAEGNVAIHTRMVLEALEAMDEFREQDEQTRALIWAAALLHDVEKRSTTAIEGGRVTSKGHAKKGEFTARHIMYTDVPTPFVIREQICALVRHHGLPLWVFEKPNPAKALIVASMRVSMPLLAMLAKSDVLGRVCQDQQELLNKVALFEEYCREQQCWDGARRFATDLARFAYFQKENSSVDYVPYDQLKGEVILLSGLPGVGKDRYIRKHHPDLPTVSLDDIRRKHKLNPQDSSATGWVVQEAKEQARQFLRKGQSFVWNATNITRQMRTQLVDLFTTYDARVKIVYIEVPYNVWIRQNNDREHAVPMNVMHRLLTKLEVPSPDEAHSVQYIV